MFGNLIYHFDINDVTPYINIYIFDIWQNTYKMEWYLSCCLNERRRVSGNPSLYWSPVSGSTWRPWCQWCWGRGPAHPGWLTPCAGLVVNQLSVANLDLPSPGVLRPRLKTKTVHHKVWSARKDTARKNHVDKHNFRLARTSWNVYLGNPPVAMLGDANINEEEEQVYLNVRIWRDTSSV